MPAMPITLTLAEIVASKDAWQKLLAADLPIKVAYWIGKRYRKVEREIIDYEKKNHDLVRKYGQPSKDRPGSIEVSPEGMEAFQGEMSDLRDIVISLDIDPIKLADVEPAKLTGRDFALLGKFIEE
jgi:hypothetical protein